MTAEPTDLVGRPTPVTTGGLSLTARLLALLPRPLDPVRSIKLKLGILLIASGAAGLAWFWFALGWIPYFTSLVAIVVALLTSQILAHGMTSPLREMTAAARAMATGDYSRRVRISSRDEVGELGDAFNQMSADLQATDQQRRDLIANVSHELRTPIAALHALLENIVDGVADPDPASLRSALAQTDRLGRLVTDLLDLSRIDAGAVPMLRREFAVQSFLARAVELAGTDGRIPILIDVQPVDLVGFGDEQRLHQVVANLLDNARRHSPSGGRIEITARPLTPGSDGRSGIRLEVSDEGPGIPVEDRARMFDRFIRGAAAARPGVDTGGTGLGLAIARWAVELHGGQIRVVDGSPGCHIEVVLPAG